MNNLDSHSNIKSITTEYVPNDLHLDVIELKNNKVVVITDTYVEIYDSLDDWNEGEMLSRGMMMFPEAENKRTYSSEDLQRGYTDEEDAEAKGDYVG